MKKGTNSRGIPRRRVSTYVAVLVGDVVRDFDLVEVGTFRHPMLTGCLNFSSID